MIGSRKVAQGMFPTSLLMVGCILATWLHATVPVFAEDAGYSDRHYWRQLRREREREEERRERRERWDDHYSQWNRYRFTQQYYNYRPPQGRKDPDRFYGYNAPGNMRPPEELVDGGTIQRSQYPPRVIRDPLSNVVCFPEIEELSAEHNSEEAAWRDAQRSFENSSRWRYGERAMDIRNATDIRKQCSRSSGNESLIGRAVEATVNAVGASGGYKVRCAIRARPCIAPVEMDPELKGKR